MSGIRIVCMIAGVAILSFLFVMEGERNDSQILPGLIRENIWDGGSTEQHIAVSRRSDDTFLLEFSDPADAEQLLPEINNVAGVTALVTDNQSLVLRRQPEFKWGMIMPKVLSRLVEQSYMSVGEANEVLDTIWQTEGDHR